MGLIVLKEYQETPDVLITYLLVYPDSGIDKLKMRKSPVIVIIIYLEKVIFTSKRGINSSGQLFELYNFRYNFKEVQSFIHLLRIDTSFVNS